mgnify:CR=1 FL=1|tara:strand:+ start:597 stop:974 length:378 start_codon:yes stop_codon:yes gene_type:complete
MRPNGRKQGFSPVLNQIKDSIMKEYTYTETEYFILKNLYYSMGVNRMTWHDYRELMIPSLKAEIEHIIHEFQIIPIKRGYSVINRADKYNSQDIDTIIRKIKEKFEIFGVHGVVEYNERYANESI